VVAEVRRAPRDEDQKVLEAAALAALDQKLAGLPAAPPPRVALRGDLDEFHSLLARLARGEEAEPTLEAWQELADGAAHRGRVAAHTYAKVLVSLGRNKEAKRLVEVALALDPGIAELHALYGRLLLGEEDLVGAEESFRAAIGLDDSVAMAHGGLAQILELAGRPEAAKARLERALELQPENPQFHYALAMLLRAEAQWEKVVEHLQGTLEVRPDDAYAHWYLAEAYAQLGKDRESTEHKMRAYKLGYKDEASSAGGEAPPSPGVPPPTPPAPGPSPGVPGGTGALEPAPAPPVATRLPGSDLEAPLPGLPTPASTASPGASGKTTAVPGP
jgi:tetratricopeptide (TPR) repeat protein